MNTKVKTRGGRDAIIIDMNGPNPTYPIAAWVSHGDGTWYIGTFTALGSILAGVQSGNDLMLTTYKYRPEYAHDKKANWWHNKIGLFGSEKVSRGTFDMDGKLIEICLLTDEQIAELRKV
jgi:hypothetical protein